MGEEFSGDFKQLKRHSLFGGVTEEAFDRIRPLVQTVRYNPGDAIMTEGMVNDRIHLIVRGNVEIVKETHGHPGHYRRITTMGEGDTFGEMELIDIQPCAATVRALDPTTTLTLSNRDLYSISKNDMKTYALLIMNLAREISRRLRATDDMVAETGAEDNADNVPSVNGHGGAGMA